MSDYFSYGPYGGLGKSGEQFIHDLYERFGDVQDYGPVRQYIAQTLSQTPRGRQIEGWRGRGYDDIYKSLMAENFHPAVENLLSGYQMISPIRGSYSRDMERGSQRVQSQIQQQAHQQERREAAVFPQIMQLLAARNVDNKKKYIPVNRKEDPIMEVLKNFNPKKFGFDEYYEDEEE